MNTGSQNACDDLQAALLKLHASGLEGFEGLIRDAYREATGIPLRLQKSGKQHGADAVPGDSVGDIAAGIEAKRYRATNCPAMHARSRTRATWDAGLLRALV